MAVRSLFTQLSRLIGVKVPRAISSLRSALDYSTQLARAFQIHIPGKAYQRAITDFRTAIQVHENRSMMRETPRRDRIAENLVSEGVVYKDRNFYTTMRVRAVNPNTHEVKNLWVSTYDDDLMSPEEHLAGLGRHVGGTSDIVGWNLNVLYVDSVVHNMGFPWES